MALFVIATIKEIGNRNKWETKGYKVLNSKTGQFKYLSVRDLNKNNLKLENAVYDETKGTLVGTQGDLKRYSFFNNDTGRIENGPRIVILGKDTEGYYLVVERPEMEEELIRRVTLNELKRMVRFSPENEDNIKVANARVDLKPKVNDTIIRPIKGQFNIISETPKFIEKEFNFAEKQRPGTVKNWLVRLIKPGEKYGRDYCLTNDKDKVLVEFYSLDENKDAFPIGQMVSRYDLATIKDHKEGLYLTADVPAWTLSRASMLEIHNWLQTV